MNTQKKYKNHFLKWVLALSSTFVMAACSGGGTSTGQNNVDESGSHSNPSRFSVSSTAPGNGETDSNPQQKVAIQFNDAVDASTVNENTIKLTDENENPVACALNLDTHNNIVLVTPSVSLEINTTYHIEISGEIKSAEGLSLGNSMTINFTTGEQASSPAPTVTNTTPENGSVSFSSNGEIRISFGNEKLDCSTVNSNTVHLEKADGTPIEASIHYDQSANIIIVNPNGSLEINSTYQLEITTEVKSLANISLSNTIVITFTTSPVENPPPEEPSPTAPQVSSVTPADGAVDVAVDVEIQIQFDQDILVSTIGDNVQLRRASDSSVVDANLAFDASTNMATLTPVSSLDASTPYQIVVTTGVQNADGVPLASEFTSSFTTVAM